MNGISSANFAQPLFSFGIISDVQYADIPDGCSFLGVPRFYRTSFDVLRRGRNYWNDEGVKFVVNLGDIVDGFCPRVESRSAVEKVVNEFAAFNGSVHHLIGNHCLYNLPREELLPLLNIHDRCGRAYYDFSLSGFRFVFLDGYDVSAIGWPEDHPNAAEAVELLRLRNPNPNKNSPDGLAGVDRRFVMFNGGVGAEQMAWLDAVLSEAEGRGEKAVVSCHLPLEPTSSSPEALLWNYGEVMDVIHRYRCVKACLSGHDHRGGYATDSRGICHRVFEAALECPPGSDAYGRIDVFDDRLSVIGVGRMKSQEMVFST
ncbi:hypothetical protein M569_10510 [Genlisea aurea]|uniref:Manganese-dependent ADP-ribose/CDP-alcohol diphosphatase n=1 Tax=Genlisea aurea TaxID=192259 RepID=S8CHZ5_9LAMI|nr:hypothetical protein M569_10510 [Genlisea aurea]